MSQNPVAATTNVSLTQENAVSKALGQTVCVLTSPEAIRHVFIKNPDNFVMHPVRQSMLKPALQNGLLSAEGKTWKVARRALSPIFTPRHIGEFPDTMRRVTEFRLHKVFRDDAIVDAGKAFLNLGYSVLSETLFSGELDADLDDSLRDIAILMNVLGKPNTLDLLEAPKWIPRRMKSQSRKAIARLRSQIRRLANSRRNDIENSEDLPQDFLTLLLTTQTGEKENLSVDQVEDQIMTFIGAGHETTSRGLTWLSYLLSQDVKTRDRFEAEIDALDMSLPSKDWMDHMPFAMACFNESMRLYPPAPLISRIALNDDVIDGKEIPKGATTFINLWALHRHELHWENPNAFDPARFMEGRAERIGRFDFLPFGVGHRVCIGQRFALHEAAIMMAVTFKSVRLNWLKSEEPPWPLMRITTRPQEPMKLGVERRS